MKKRPFNIIAVCLVVVFYVTIFCLIWTWLSNFGANRHLEIRVDFGQPPRIIYIAGIDTALDFFDATLVVRNASGSFPGEEFPLEQVLNRITVKHPIDFAKPGVYEVKLIYNRGRFQYPIFFFVQVIDEETFTQLKEGVR